MTLYRYWSVAQQMTNVERNAIGHLSRGDWRTLCGKSTKPRWESSGEVLGEDFFLDEVGCKRCRAIADKLDQMNKDKP